VTGSAAVLGLVAFASQAPTLLLGPVGGLLADRVSRRRILVCTQLAEMGVAVALALLAAKGLLMTETLVAAALVLGVAIAFEMPARQALVADRTLLGSAVEEILRIHHPTQSTSTNRRCTRDVALGGKIMKAGDTVRVGLGAANRDPAVFADGDRLDIRRKMPSPPLALGAPLGPLPPLPVRRRSRRTRRGKARSSASTGVLRVLVMPVSRGKRK
jgi:hypothetical protein